MIKLEFTIEEVFELLQGVYLDGNSDINLLRAYEKLKNAEIKEDR